MTQSENINLYLQTLPTYQLSDTEVTDLVSLAREGNADAFIELVRANIKPMLEFKRAMASRRFSPFEHAVVTAIGITRSVGRLLNWRPLSSDELCRRLRRSMAHEVEYAVCFCDKDCQSNRLDIFGSSLERVVAKFFQTNDRMPSPDEVVEQIKTIDHFKELGEDACKFAGVLYERSANRHRRKTTSQYLVGDVGNTLANHSDVENLKFRLSEQCLTVIADEIGEALSLSPERVGEIKGWALTMFNSATHYCLTKYVYLN